MSENVCLVNSMFCRGVRSIDVVGNISIMNIEINFLRGCLNILKNHFKYKYGMLMDLICVDHKVGNARFEISYVLLNCLYNKRLFLRIFAQGDRTIFFISTVSDIFSSSEWLEREIWDLFGILIVGHVDMRRILTDYGFDGHPLRKEFPLSGYLEIRYSDSDKDICTEDVLFMQEFRCFDFNSPWC